MRERESLAFPEREQDYGSRVLANFVAVSPMNGADWCKAAMGNKNYVVKVYPNGSHSLLKTDSGGPSTEAKEINFMPGFWTMQTDWLLRHVSIPK